MCTGGFIVHIRHAGVRHMNIPSARVWHVSSSDCVGKANEVDCVGEKSSYVGLRMISGACSVTKDPLCLWGKGWILWAAREKRGCRGRRTDKPVVVKYEDREE